MTERYINIPLLTTQESEINERQKKKLINVISENDAVLFVGAGLSTHECPDWEKLIVMLEELALLTDNSFTRNNVQRKEQPLKYIDKIKEVIATKNGNYARYETELQHIFEKNKCKEIHKKLFSIPFVGYITTNYDMILESALISSKQNHDLFDCWFTLEEDNAFYANNFLRTLNHSNKKPKNIAHIHGIYKYPSKIILSYKDYVKNYGLDSKGDLVRQPTIHYNFLHTIFSSKNVVFIGFSMDDPFITLMLNIVCKNYHLWNSPSHFFITDINRNNKLSRINNSRKFLNDFAISTIFYENEMGNHHTLEYFINEMISEIGMPMSQNTQDELFKWTRDVNRKMINKSRKNET